MDFSVLMSVYRNTKIDELEQCLVSLYEQTVKSNEIVIVIDGPINEELNSYLYSQQKEHNEIKICPIEKNVGLGNALKFGLENCSNELVARMDTDDICKLDRFEKQLNCFKEDDDLDVVGSNIKEFIGDVSNLVAERQVPLTHDEIRKFMRVRDAFNHMSIMFKKSAIEKAGGYLPWHLNEDSYLWARLYLTDAKFKNLEEALVFARVGEDMYARRGGYKYFKSEKGILKFKLKNKIIGWFTYVKQICIRFTVQVLMTNGMRSWFYKKFARKQIKKEK